jgi:ribosome assembly protein 1
MLHRRLKHKLGGSKSEDVFTDVMHSHTYGFDDHLETGFQLATLQGPLCGEPVEGLAYFIESLEFNKEILDDEMCMCFNIFQMQRPHDLFD